MSQGEEWDRCMFCYVMFDDGILGKKTQFILAIASFMHILVELY